MRLPRSLLLPFIPLLLLVPPPSAQGAPPDWQALSQPPLEVLYHPGGEEFAREVARRSQGILGDLSARLGIIPQGPFTVYAVKSRDELASLLPRAAPPPDWVAALAFPRAGTIFLLSPVALRSPGEEYWQVLHHEMTHLVVGEAAARRDTSLPRWLDEGIATWMAGEMNLPRLLHLGWAQVTGSTIPFEALEDRFPEESGRAEVAYAQSYLMVQYLGKRFGQGAVAKLVGEYLRERDLAGAVRRAFGTGWDEVQAGFDDYSRMKATWIPLATSTGTIWGLTVLLFLYTVRHKKAGEKDVRERWAREEADERAWLLSHRRRKEHLRIIDGGKQDPDEEERPTIH